MKEFVIVKWPDCMDSAIHLRKCERGVWGLEAGYVVASIGSVMIPKFETQALDFSSFPPYVNFDLLA